MSMFQTLFVFFSVYTTAGLVVTADPYHGKLIGTFTTLAHGVSGTVYAVDNSRLKITNFIYDGGAPDAFFWAGSTDNPSPSGQIIPDEENRSSRLGAYDNQDIIITLPEGSTINDFKWIAVWCRQYTANFGQVNIPDNFDAPSELDLGEFSQLAHGLRGHVYIVDAKTFRIENLHYDGNGPDAYFWVGTGPSPHVNGIRIPDENGRLTRLYAYNGQTVSITMQDDLTVFDIDWLSMWCVLARQNFGHVFIPNDLNIPPYVPEMQETVTNCEAVNDNFHVSWTLVDDYIDIELSGRVGFGEYLSFGISGSDTSTSMVGSDVTVVWNDKTNGVMVVDYDLNAYAQCSQGRGACPDTMVTGGRNDVTDISSLMKDGITTIGFRRMLNTGDANDKIIPTDSDVYVVWSIGFINDNGVVAKHHTIPNGNVRINFGREPANNCPVFPDTTLAPVTPWEQIYITGNDNNTEFVARIGQAGGRRGYTALTGQVSWGITWFINDKLIPILKLQRGMNYTFVVEGGNNSSQSAQYHPFYITDDPIGGYIQKSAQERQEVQVLAGVEFDSDGNPYPTAAGRYCEFVTKDYDRSEESETFDEYFQTLRLECQAGEPAVLNWTPDTVGTFYYQCYTHQYLGWKIEVVDDVDTTVTTSQGPTSPSTPTAGGATDKQTPPVVDDGSDVGVSLSVSYFCIYFVVSFFALETVISFF
ncbi:protein Skeletor, isoforms B/C-like [Glandiceps talaboti]